MVNAKLLPLAILYVDDGEAVEGVTRMQKLVFLGQQEHEELHSKYEFEAYDYGPYSKKLYDALDTLVDRGLVHRQTEKTPSGNEKYVYSITPRGRRLVERTLVTDEAQRDLFVIAEDVKKHYNDMPLRELLQRVYNAYPDYTTKSKLDL